MAFKADHALQLLDRARQRGRLGHAYLICGPDAADLQGFAVRLLNLIDGTRHDSLESVRDAGVPMLSPTSKSRRVLIGDSASEPNTMRWFLSQMQMTPPQGRRKLGLILEADRMMDQAQNAFLKTLEEPPPGTLLLLLTEHPESLLETTRSRMIRVSLLPENTSRKLNSDEQRLAAVLSELSKRKSGSLASALGLRREFEEILEAIHERIEKQLEGEFDDEKKHLKQATDVSAQWLGEREKGMLAAVEARYLQERDALMELLLAWMGDVLRHQAGAMGFDLQEYVDATRALAQRWDAATLSRCLGSLRRLNSNLHTNVNETLALDTAFIEAFG